jgi:hypothetical protein
MAEDQCFAHARHELFIFVGAHVTTTEICFTSSLLTCTTAQEKSTHAGGIASRVTMRPLELRKLKQQQLQMQMQMQRNVVQDATDTKVKKGNLNRHKGKKKETLEVSGSTNGTNTGSEME